MTRPKWSGNVGLDQVGDTRTELDKTATISNWPQYTGNIAPDNDAVIKPDQDAVEV